MKFNLFIFILVLTYSCKVQEHEEVEYLRWVGDTEFNPQLDSPTYKLCNPDQVGQYHNYGMGLQYEGEKSAINQFFKDNYSPVKSPHENGLIRIRFIVNCKGETDRFRILCMDNSYQPFEFDHRIVRQILGITKKLDGWKVLYKKNQPKDYYQYLIFKIKNGQIIEIMP